MQCLIQCFFLIEKSFRDLSSLLHNLTYLSLLNSFLLLVLSTFPGFLKSLKNYFFRLLPYKSLLAEFQCCNKLLDYTMRSSNLYFYLFIYFGSSCFPRFSGFTFFWVRVQDPDPGSGSMFQKQTMQSNFIEITPLHGCFPANVLHIFRTISHKITSRGLLLNIKTNKREKGDRKIQCN